MRVDRQRGDSGDCGDFAAMSFRVESSSLLVPAPLCVFGVAVVHVGLAFDPERDLAFDPELQIHNKGLHKDRRNFCHLQIIAAGIESRQRRAGG